MSINLSVINERNANGTVRLILTGNQEACTIDCMGKKPFLSFLYTKFELPDEGGKKKEYVWLKKDRLKVVQDFVKRACDAEKVIKPGKNAEPALTKEEIPATLRDQSRLSLLPRPSDYTSSSIELASAISIMPSSSLELLSSHSCLPVLPSSSSESSSIPGPLSTSDHGPENLKRYLYDSPKELLHATKSYFDEQPIPAPKDYSKANISSIKRLVSSLLKDNEGIAIGEAHDDSAPKYVLDVYAKHLVACGVETVFIEGLNYQRHQIWVDTFLKSSSNDLPAALKERVHTIESHQEEGLPYYRFTDVLLAFRRAGIKRIVCLETNASEGIVKNDDYWQRIATMNYQALRIIENTVPKGKYVVFTGLDHNNGCLGVPSLGQLLQIPSISVLDSQLAKKGDPAKISIVDQELTTKISHEDFRVTMPAPLKIKPTSLMGKIKAFFTKSL